MQEKPWVVWTEGWYGSTVTDVKCVEARAAVLYCVGYAAQHSVEAATGSGRAWCVGEHDGNHPPKVFERYVAEFTTDGFVLRRLQ